MSDAEEEVIKKPRRKKLRRYRRPRIRGARATSKVKKNYTAIAARPEHYYMLRELAEFYNAPLTRTVAAIIVNEYCRLLAKTDPTSAAEIKKTYVEDAQQSQYIIPLSE